MCVRDSWPVLSSSARNQKYNDIHVMDITGLFMRPIHVIIMDIQLYTSQNLISPYCVGFCDYMDLFYTQVQIYFIFTVWLYCAITRTGTLKPWGPISVLGWIQVLLVDFCGVFVESRECVISVIGIYVTLWTISGIIMTTDSIYFNSVKFSLFNFKENVANYYIKLAINLKMTNFQLIFFYIHIL